MHADMSEYVIELSAKLRASRRALAELPRSERKSDAGKMLQAQICALTDMIRSFENSTEKDEKGQTVRKRITI